ncbi:hypothetical protein ALC57_01764 [Trachymyrmex cornetzi]|uniref:Uncharacterized protein n=1 Tax=Trachymyrmex cornetzi TaxID=471704 RepID=A0A195EKY1_9HYME|nr:hypothetical protein ALC57_01764 [Trachymyrmex cornetzi]
MLRAILKMINNRKHTYSNHIKYSSSNAGYILSQPTRTPRNLPQWRYESPCLDFRICHRHADFCISPFAAAILLPFILSFDFLSQIARNFMPPCLLSSLTATISACSLSYSLPHFLNFHSLSVLGFSPVSRTSSVAELFPVFLLRELLRISGPSWRTTNSPPYLFSLKMNG